MQVSFIGIEFVELERGERQFFFRFFFYVSFLYIYIYSFEIMNAPTENWRDYCVPPRAQIAGIVQTIFFQHTLPNATGEPRVRPSWGSSGTKEESDSGRLGVVSEYFSRFVFAVELRFSREEERCPKKRLRVRIPNILLYLYTI